jgi:putative flavoprotein involved in K+ transport
MSAQPANGKGSDRFDTVIIGGGQAGLATAYYLSQRGHSFVILDANQRTGHSWRMRWDSLRLFTPRSLSSLPGLRMAGTAHLAPAKDEMADYLETYAEHFALPIRRGVTVDMVWRNGTGFAVGAGSGVLEADNVVIATGAYGTPWVPPFAAHLDPAIISLHSHDYRGPSQLRDGRVLVVGAGNSGADISIEVARTHPTLLAGRDTGHVPFDIDTPAARVLIPVVRFVGHHVLNLSTPLGRKACPGFLSKGGPLVRVKPKQIAAAGITRVDKVTGVTGGKPCVGDTVVDVANVIWCTGYQPELSWLDLPVIGAGGAVEHDRGVSAHAGLYFVGLRFQYAATSDIVTGLARDAAHVAKHIISRDAASKPVRAAGRRPR